MERNGSDSRARTPNPELEAEVDGALDTTRLFVEYADELDLKSLLLDNTFDGIIAHTDDGRVVYSNEAAHRQLGYTRAQFAALGPWGWIAPDMRGSVPERLRLVRERGALLFTSRGAARDGRVIETEIHARTIPTPYGELIVSVVRDVTERCESEREVRHLAYHDRLTDLANRARLEDDLSAALARADRHHDCIGIIFLDLDDFKPVNDELGHATGDKVLQIVASRLLGVVRECDTVARLGGDEFVILVQRIAGPGDLSLVAHKLVAAVEQPIRVDGEAIGITASAGLALYEAGESPEDLIARADRSMYRAKQRGVPGWEAFLRDQP
ncbi:MAG: sensor domain-containing diguanylate cyclase [Coriobacteriia bacterium]|nr:sensor domain-containing diguanylate cyclase [Coriobacteriia bacterium]